MWDRMHTFLTHHELQENRHINQSDSSLRILTIFTRRDRFSPSERLAYEYW